ncbi:MAG: flavodoxin [Oscillospiraceae bacterium]|jgi:flavodoxin|nr:flavodoxin [Oscillospiraceae bacterium]
MKSLVVFYSWTKNTKLIAEEIAQQIGGELQEIEEAKGKKSFGGAAVGGFFGTKPEIKPMDFSLDGYENVFIGTPLWAAKSVPAINTFLEKADLTNKKVFLFVTQADDKEPKSVIDSVSQRVEKKGGRLEESTFMQTKMKQVIEPQKAKEFVSDWLERIKEKI